MAIRLCIVTTHPIQYMVPWFRQLACEPKLKLDVIFFRELDPIQQGTGFGVSFQWDVPLREGYDSRVLGLKSGFSHLTRLMLALKKNIFEIRPDVVLVTGWNEAGLVMAYPLLQSMKIPVIIRGESNALRQRSWLKRVFHRLLLKQADAAVVIGDSNRQFYLENGMLSSRLFPGAYFVDNQFMLNMAAEHSEKRDSLRDSFGFGAQDFVFTFVGKHVPFKRPCLLVDAAALLRAKGYSVKLLFAGFGELTESLRKRAIERQVPAHFTGFLNQTEMWKAYIPADAFVLPSNSGETWGLVTNEAMLFGLPVIVSDQVGCGPDLVLEDKTGYIFSGGAEGLANAMEKLLKQRHRASDMGKAGRQHIIENYSMEVATRGLREAVHYLTG